MGPCVLHASAGDDSVMTSLKHNALLHWLIAISLMAGQFWLSHSMGQIGLIRIGSVVFLGLLPLLLCIWPLGIKWSDLGFARPKNMRRIGMGYLLIGLVAPLLILVGMKMAGSVSYYGGIFSQEHSFFEKLRDLSSFVLASTFLLEFFFRSFLFMGHRKFSTSRPWLRASFIVLGEIFVHLRKPAEEIAGVGVLSIILCWMTHRTQSVWPALFLHLWIESWFVLSFFL